MRSENPDLQQVPGNAVTLGPSKDHTWRTTGLEPHHSKGGPGTSHTASAGVLVEMQNVRPHPRPRPNEIESASLQSPREFEGTLPPLVGIASFLAFCRAPAPGSEVGPSDQGKLVRGSLLPITEPA